MDLPVWQELRTELHPKGVEIVTVALDTGGADDARPWIEAANPDHPSLIDAAHLVDELFGVVNVPNAVWIDEAGTIVRPAEPAIIQRGAIRDMKVPTDLPPVLVETINEAKKIQADPERYVAALRDWAERGADSPYALEPDEVVRCSGPRPRAVAQAAASFELGQHLYRAGRTDEAVRWFREAHALQPDNWTYKRQAWQFADPFQGPTDLYEGNWLADIKKIGAENYYPPLDM
jgi:tetratricopeptide (TPR) repeat protein